MSLFKKPGLPFWQVRYQLNGVDVRKSTGTTNLREAQAFERRLRSEAEAALKRSAVRPLSEIRDADFRRMRLLGRSDGYIHRGVGSYFNALAAYFPDTGSITASSLEDYIEYRLALGIRRQTVRRELGALRRGLRAAKVRGPEFWPGHGSDSPDPKLASKKHDTARWQAWLALLRGEAYAVALFALLTGMRREELYRAQPGDVVDGVITVREKVKRARARQVVLSPWARLLADLGCLPFVADHKKAHAAASRATGVTNITLRDCRAACATAADKAGDSRATDMMMGHSGVPSRYQQYDYDRLRAAALAVESWLLDAPLPVSLAGNPGLDAMRP